MRIGIYGGSFDPIHNGHVALVRDALASGFIDCAIIVPTVKNNFKQFTMTLPAPYRYYMAKTVVDDLKETGKLDNIYVCDAEFGIKGISYTFMTLEIMTEPDFMNEFLTTQGVKKKKAEGPHEYFWIMGSDTLGTFETWYKPEEILRHATLLAAERPGDSVDVEKAADSVRENLGGKVETFRLNGVECASSEILRSGDFSAVPEAAREFIKTHELYTERTKLKGVSDAAKEKFFECAVWMYPYLGEKRLLHTLNVGYLSAELAVRFGADPDKALIAGALHDCAKELDIDSQREMAAEYCGDLFTDKKLLHSPAGAVFARDGFGEKDKEILDAVCYHTTGRGNMSKLEKIVYLADKIEPARNYMDLAPIREMVKTDLDEACRMTALAIKAKTESNGKVIHPSNVDMLRDLGL
ncbi:MAG: bis(5'-nucleosyl)-tetraphosphatase (symmetrical) YqeK [Clostridiales bacterium]|nr:bis(5'-nucleosyl)-tetraphosphatase (symmetrical) YqeK [Clostridiales bacterium]